MVETLILIFKIIGLICVISAMVGVTLAFPIWLVWSVIDAIRYSDGWHF